jgi:hypothetical protein
MHTGSSLSRTAGAPPGSVHTQPRTLASAAVILVMANSLAAMASIVRHAVGCDAVGPNRSGCRDGRWSMHVPPSINITARSRTTTPGS